MNSREPLTFLQALGLAEHAPAFVEAGIYAANLASLTDMDLRKLEVLTLSDREKILFETRRR